MLLENPKIMTSAHHVRDLLISHYMNNPNVILIDIRLRPDMDEENKMMKL